MRWDVYSDCEGHSGCNSRSRYEYYVDEEIAVDKIDVSFPYRDAYNPMLVGVYCAAHYLELQEICSILHQDHSSYFRDIADIRDLYCFKDRPDLQGVIGNFPKKSESRQFFYEVDGAKVIIRNIIEAEFGPNLPDDVFKRGSGTEGFREYWSKIQSEEWIDLGGEPSVAIKRSYLSGIERQLSAFSDWFKQCESKKPLPRHGDFRERFSLDDINEDDD